MRFLFWKFWLPSMERIVGGYERNQGEQLGAVAIKPDLS